MSPGQLYQGASVGEDDYKCIYIPKKIDPVC